MKSFYGFDKIEIATRLTVDELTKFRKSLGRIPKKIARPHQDDAPQNVRRQGYRSIFRLITPSPEFLELLCKNVSGLGKYKIIHIELCCDLPFESESEAEHYTNELTQYTHKLYSKRFCLFENNKPNPSKGAFGRSTLYLGPLQCQYVMYARTSKLCDKPSAHFEWRLVNREIKNKLGVNVYDISTVKSLNIAEAYNELTAKYMRHSNINESKLGYHLMGWPLHRKSKKQDKRRILICNSLFFDAKRIVSRAKTAAFMKCANSKYHKFIEPTA